MSKAPPSAEEWLRAVGYHAQRVQEFERVPSPLEDARTALHQAMREARDAGHTLQEIADAAGVTRQRVHQIVGEEQNSG